ncbi:ATP-binding protein [Aminirod propionatiphilus]|uniref:Response regulator n=1 Tax=Aminirod propionatiphilus TaxID=3415223 RepID=A0ACD1DV61_9BACT|nr:response regulator [Synergistota bacterium]
MRSLLRPSGLIPAGPAARPFSPADRPSVRWRARQGASVRRGFGAQNLASTSSRGRGGLSRSFRSYRPREEATAILLPQPFSSLISNLPAVLFRTDGAGRVLFVTASVADLTGHGAEAFLDGAVRYDDLIGGDDRKAVAEAIDGALRRGESWEVEYRIVGPGGAIRWVLERGRPFDGEGLSCLDRLLLDVTERHEEKEALLREGRLQRLLMTLASSFVNVPLDSVEGAIGGALAEMGTFVGADRAYVFDYDFEGGFCSNSYEWCAPAVEPQIDNLQAVPLALVPEWVAAHRRGEAVYIVDVQALPPGGLRKTLEPQGIRSLLALPVMKGEEPIGFVGFDFVAGRHACSAAERDLLSLFGGMLVNIDLRRRSDRAWREAAERAEVASRAKGEFLANMSHEIRTPLNGILGMAGLLAATKLSADQKECVETIRLSGETLLALVNDILDFSKMEAGRLLLDRVDFDVRRLVDDVLSAFAVRARTKGIGLSGRVEGVLPPSLRGDPLRIRQILTNLVGNALKFTPKGEVTLRVVPLGEGPEGLWLQFSVSDTGIGIPADKAGGLFDRFFQVDSSVSRRFGGTGLGLAIAKQLVELMGGRIGVESREGEGSTFRFSLPLPPGRGAIAPGSPFPAGKAVLVVEDNVINRKVLLNLLKGLGLEADVAGDGRQALETMAGKIYDLVLMDVQMPVMDGLEAVRRIRSGQAGTTNRSVPVVAVTAHAMAGDRDVCFAAGMDDYISKPISPEVLAQVVGRWLPGLFRP